MKKFVLIAFLFTCIIDTQAQGWQKTFGGSSVDESFSVTETSDGGYALVGYLNSGALEILKTNSLGDTLWTKEYGPPGYNPGYHIEQTSDGGFIVTGSTLPLFTSESNVYLIKTDSNGDSLWTKQYTFINSYRSVGNSVKQTSDGGYIICGEQTDSVSNYEDVILIKTNSFGDAIWTKKIGTMLLRESGRSVEQTTDGGYIISGWILGTASTFGRDGYFVKTDNLGNVVWTKIYGDNGGPDEYIAHEIRQTSDGGYAAAGEFYFTGSPMRVKTWLLKLDPIGDTLWTKKIAIGSNFNVGNSLQQTTDGGYVIAGRIGDTNGSPGTLDVLLIKTNSTGDTLWTKKYGQIGVDDWGYCAKQTTDGGYIIAGDAGEDMYLIKTDGNGNSTPLTYPVILAASSTTLLCSGTCNGAGIVIPSGGTPGYTYLWSSGETTNVVTTLCAGSYTVTVTDAVGTTATVIVNITEPTLVVLAPIFSVTICNGQSTTLTANANGGNGGYTYTWNGTFVGQNYTVSPTSTTTYTVTASDVNGCAAAPISVTVTVTICTGIQSQSSEIAVINIFPNPFTTQTTIDLNADYRNATIKIIDVLGKELKSINFSGKQVILEREELKAGMYFIQIISENKTIATNKIIIN